MVPGRLRLKGSRSGVSKASKKTKTKAKAKDSEVVEDGIVERYGM